MVLDGWDEREIFYIYGAQVVAYGAYEAIRTLRGLTPECFLVSCLEGNPSEIDGIAVRTPEGVPRDALILLCVTELLQDEILESLRALGFTRIFRMTQHEEHLLMARYFSAVGDWPLADIAEKAIPAEASTDCSDVDFVLYEVRNHRDKPLGSRPQLRSFEKPIQAGAALTPQRIASITDHTGINISTKNRQYCEITATYWVWKNTAHAWKGIEHYRRHLLVRPEMLHGRMDAILPFPYCCYPNTIAQFRRFVGEDVLAALLDALRVLHPREYDNYLAILHGKYQYTYNLVCARRAVFDDYCAWFFQVTEFMEKQADRVPALIETRALSYVAEVLTNLYFMSHRERLAIFHAEKAIYA